MRLSLKEAQRIVGHDVLSTTQFTSPEASRVAP